MLYQVRQQSKGNGAEIYTVGGCSFSIKGGKSSLKFIENIGQDSVQHWREKWFYVKDIPVEGQKYNLAPFANAKVVPLKAGEQAKQDRKS